MKNKLYRNEDAGVIGGVCAGIAEYSDTDIFLWRLIFVIAAICLTPMNVIIYILMWISLPSTKN